MFVTVEQRNKKKVYRGGESGVCVTVCKRASERASEREKGERNGSLNLVDIQSIVMEACKEKERASSRRNDEEHHSGERRFTERTGWGNSVLWWQRFRVAKGGYQRVEAAAGGRRGSGTNCCFPENHVVLVLLTQDSREPPNRI